MGDNGWYSSVELNQGSLSEPQHWMTRDLPDGWTIHLRLATTGDRTVISELRIHPSESTPLRGMRGRVDVPTGTVRSPKWQSIPLRTARREAAAALHEHLRQLHQTNRDREAGAEPPTAGDTLQHHLTTIAHLRGFTTITKKDLELAIIAAAYHATISAKPPPGTEPESPREGTLTRLRQIGMYCAHTTLASKLTHARAANMLTPTQPGKAGGELTPHALETLAAANFQVPWQTAEG